MTCSACPFSGSFEAEQALNWGCLPDAVTVMEIKRETGKNWGCHEDEARLCAGFARACRESGISISAQNLASYSSWYHSGNP